MAAELMRNAEMLSAKHGQNVWSLKTTVRANLLGQSSVVMLAVDGGEAGDHAFDCK